MQVVKLSESVLSNRSQLRFYHIEAGDYEILRHEPYTGPIHEFAETGGWYIVRTPMGTIRRLPVRLFKAN